MPEPLIPTGVPPLLATDLRPTTLEQGDAAASRATAARMSPGQVFGGAILGSHDHDWVAITLAAGHTYRVTMTGNGPGAMRDTVVAVRGPGGALLATNDDTGAWDNSVVTWTAAASGTYYIDAGGYGGSQGDYALRLDRLPSPGQPWSMDHVARYLTDGYWQDSGWARHHFDAQTADTLTVNLTALRPVARDLALSALSSWAQVSGLQFKPVTRADANIVFDEVDDGQGAYSTVTALNGAIVTQALVRIPAYWFGSPGTGHASYEYHTYIHEIGHALGLGHAGLYNGTGAYATDALYPNDSWQATVMSYFDQLDNTFVDASRAFAATPMIADILAIQDLYGTPRALFGGNTTWGAGSTVGGAMGTATRLMAAGADITMTIQDQGGVDLLNLANDSRGQRINLTGGTVSSCYGLTGNLSIARGTVIENLSCGAGADVVWGNAAANRIAGNRGADSLAGGLGADTLNGGAGIDRLTGGPGNDVFAITAGDIVVERAGGGIDRILSAGNVTLGAHVEHVTLTGSAAAGVTGNGLSNRIAGNAGANVIDGGGGWDVLSGGGGADVFQFRPGSSGRVTDWQDDLDMLRIVTGRAPASAADVLATALDTVSGVSLTVFGARLLIDGTTVALLQDDLIVA